MGWSKLVMCYNIQFRIMAETTQKDHATSVVTRAAIMFTSCWTVVV